MGWRPRARPSPGGRLRRPGGVGYDLGGGQRAELRRRHPDSEDRRRPGTARPALRYGTYADPVNSVVNTRPLAVKSVARGPSLRWPEIFGQAGFEVDHITVEIPAASPWTSTICTCAAISAAVAARTATEDMQPHALQVVDGYDGEIKIVQITDTHVYGPENQERPQPGLQFFRAARATARHPQPHRSLLRGVPGGFPMDKDMDGKSNEGAIYLQEELQAINLIDPDFVVFTGDSVFSQKNSAPTPRTPGCGETSTASWAANTVSSTPGGTTSCWR